VVSLRINLLLALTIILLTIHLANACLIEYRVVEYKPDKTQITAPYSGKYIQNVIEDFVMLNFTNNYSFTITDVNIKYKNTSIRIPVVKPEETVKSADHKPVDITKFNISLDYSITGNSNRFKVTFTIKNDYPYAIHVNITFPKPNWIQNCINCQMENEIVFNDTIPAKSSKSFTLIGSGNNAKLENGTIEFEVHESAMVEFSASIPFSIEKGYSDDSWYANFSVHNSLPIPVNVTVIGYVNTSQPPHTLNNSTQLFSITSELKPNKSWNKTVRISITPPSIPGFFVKVISNARDTCQVKVYPATKVGKSYLQYGVVAGFNIILPPTPTLTATTVTTQPPPAGGGLIGGGGAGGGRGVISPPSKPKPQQPQQPQQPQPQQSIIQPPPPLKREEIPKKPSEVPLVFPVKSNVRYR